jgi:hypothetical protein
MSSKINGVNFYESREVHVTTPTNNFLEFPFQFSFKLPDPRKSRIIVSRDSLGRIISSKSPAIPKYEHR